MSDKQDKQFDPTPQRIRKAREEGNLFKSQESTAVGMLTVGVTTIAVGMPLAFHVLRNIMTELFLGSATNDLTIAAMPPLLADLAGQVLLMLSPFFVVLVGAALSLNLMQGGLNLTLKPLVPKGERLSPLKGLKRIFSPQGAANLVKSLVKIALVAPLAYGTIKQHLPEIMMLHTLGIEDVLSDATSWILVLVAKMIAGLLVLSGADFAFEKWRYKRDLKMSHQEIKDEGKESEGNPQMKGKRRQKAMEIANRPRLDHAVLQADVVVTNPTHYAVALRYDPLQDDAPVVLVKGMRKRALRIKGLAKEHGIPTVEDRPLARALYASVEEEQSIPEDLYPAVAALLAEIFRNRGQ